MASEELGFVCLCCPIFCLMEYKYYLDRSVYSNTYDYKTVVCNSSIYTEN